MSGSSSHDVFRVPEEFANPQAAIDAAQRPTTILLSPGLYVGSFRISEKPYVVLQSTLLSLRGVTLSAESGDAVLDIAHSTAHLSGIEVRSNHRTRGIRVADSTLSLQECVVAGNRIVSDDACCGAGLACDRSSVKLQKSLIAGNTLDCEHGAGAGASFESCKVEIAGCTFDANAIWARGDARGSGIFSSGSRMRMWRSRVTDNAMYAAHCEGGGLYFRDALDTQIGGSVITGNGGAGAHGGGIFVIGAGTVSIHRNTTVRRNHPDDVCLD